MKLSDNEFRDLTRNFLAEGLLGNERRLHEQPAPTGTEDQSYDDFIERMSKVNSMLESLYMDYARYFPRGGWLMDTGNKELANDLSNLYSKANNLLNDGKNAAEKVET